jgi:hypothetical protein
MLEAVPYAALNDRAKTYIRDRTSSRILQPTSWQPERPGPSGLQAPGQQEKTSESAGCKFIRIIRDIIEVPFPRAASSRFMSFLTFHISILQAHSRQYCGSRGEAVWVMLTFFSASFAWASDIFE